MSSDAAPALGAAAGRRSSPSTSVDLVAALGFDVVTELGRGAQTVVYRVRRGGTEYALKIVDRPVGDDRETMAAFRREAALLARVDHPGLAKIYEVGQVGLRPFLVMDLIEGRRLTDLLTAGALPESVVVRLAIDIAEALAAAHRAGLVHRDVKPDNIVICPDGQARVIDFGLAARASAVRGADVVGTLAYSAPEQTGVLCRLVDGRSDLYSLGVMLYECLTGELPFVTQDLGELLRMHASQPPPDPTTIRPGLSAALVEIVLKSLAKDPDDRYANGVDLIAELRQVSPANVGQPGHSGVGPSRPGPDGVGRSQGGQPGPTDGCGPNRSFVEDTPLTGRDTELSELVEVWQRALAGSGSVVVLRGPAGCGKTRLAREVAAAVRRDGCPVLTGRCESGDPAPLAPVRAAIDGYVRGLDTLPMARRQSALQRLRLAAQPVASLVTELSPALAAVVPAEPLREGDRREQFATAVAAFLGALAELEGGLLLHLDDLHGVDQATGRLLGRLAQGVRSSPLLVVIGARDEDQHAAGWAAVRTALAGRIDVDLTVGPLSPAAVSRLVAGYLPGARMDAEIALRLAARSGGNPGALVEYLNTIVDAGLLRPSWGTWRLDVDELDRLALPATTMELVLDRIERLDPVSREILQLAATVGAHFPADLLSRVSGRERSEVTAVLAGAVQLRLVEPRQRDEYVFLHDQIAEALLAKVDPTARTGLHQRIAELLDNGSADANDPLRYELARHYLRGEPERTAQRAFDVCYAAGRQALASHAPQEALDFLEPAAELAATAGLAPVSGFHTTLGVARHRSGQLPSARDALVTALAVETDPLARARAHVELAQLDISCWDPQAAITTSRQGLAELGHPMSRSRSWRTVSTLAVYVVALLIDWTGIGFGTVTGVRRERYRVRSALHEATAHAAAIDLRMGQAAMSHLRAMFFANRLGLTDEYVWNRAGLGYAVRLLGLHWYADVLFDQATAAVSGLVDQRLAAIVGWLDGCSRYLSGLDDGQLWQSNLELHGDWLDQTLYREAIRALCRHEVVRGNTADAERCYEAGVARCGQPAGRGLETAEVALHALLGRLQRAAVLLAAMASSPAAGLRGHQLETAISAVQVALEQGDYGERLEEGLADFAAVQVEPRRLTLRYRSFFVYQAFGRLEQVRITPTAELRRRRLAAARVAVRQLGRVASSPLLRGYHRVAEASLAQLGGDPGGALRRLVKLEPLLLRLDSPLVACEAAVVRARALAELSYSREAGRQARHALALATENSWGYRIRRIRSEFPIVAQLVSHALSGTASNSAAGPAGAAARRRLEALEQVSAAAARILDPGELARVALDEMIRILAADRAFLFLTEGPFDDLVPRRGRTAAGMDLEELVGYSASLVERVRDTRQVLVVTGGDDGPQHTAVSITAHGLRSVMAAPLLIEGRLLGVVYLDSRVAKGIFTSADAGILTAIASHIAVSLETARAAQLEVAVQAAHRQRDAAEMLRQAMTTVGQTLEPAEVLGRLLDRLAFLLPGDRGWLLRCRTAETGKGGDLAPAEIEVIADQGGSRDQPVAGDCLPATADLLELFEVTSPATGPLGAALAGHFGAGTCRIVLPLVSRGRSLGIALLVAAAPEGYQEAQVELGAALVEHAMVAYDNARLFVQVHQLATTDPLTGLANRRSFLDLAGREFATARRRSRPLAALMIDIDYFKQVNDLHGHQAGDDVIRTVATWIRAGLREHDLVGRYGGEEFAVVLPHADDLVTERVERLRAAVAAQPVPTGVGEIAVTVSVGLAFLHHDQSLDLLLARADRALYAAKATGRNCVVRAAEPPTPDRRSEHPAPVRDL